MSCIRCNGHLPADNYALVDGMQFCLPCYLEDNLIHSTVSTVCQTCGNIPSSSASSGRRSVSKREKMGSTTSLNSISSAKIAGAARRVGTAISRAFRQQRSSSTASSTPDHYDEKPPRPSKVHPQTCQVCFDEKPSKQFHPLPYHTCLLDKRTICDECVHHHVQQSFQEMCTDDVRCPELQCGGQLHYTTVKHILLSNKDKKLFERYERFLFHHQLEQMNEFIWCSNPKCQMGQLNDGGPLNNIVTCTYCRHRTCFIHKVKWHEGLTCQEYDATTNGDLKASLRWLNVNTKTCPNCPYQIEKNSGCDHMTCIKCRHEFCWCCLADYNRIRRDGNHRHHPNCKHYTAN